MDQEELHEGSELENEPVYSTNVIEFVTVASEYCGFVENIGKFGRNDFIEKSIKLLPLLYLKSTLLPKLDSVYDVVNEKFVAEYDWTYVKDGIAEKLGSFDSFIEVKDLSVQATTDVINLSISECFADIYQDLKNFVSLYQIGNTESMRDGLWECRLNFEQIWGQRVLAVLNNFHDLYFGSDEIPEKDEVTTNQEREQITKNAWVNTFFDKTDEFE